MLNLFWLNRIRKKRGNMLKAPEPVGESNSSVHRQTGWGKYLLASSLLLAPQTMGCSGNSHKAAPAPADSFGIWTTPYHGNMVEDENGDIYMGSRFILKFQDSVSNESVENMIGGMQGTIVAQIPQLNTFGIEVPDDSNADASVNLDAAIDALSKASGVEFAGRNYFFESAAQRDNDGYAVDGNSLTYCGSTAQASSTIPMDVHDNGMWWSSQISLTAGLNLFDASTLTKSHVTIA